MNKFRFTLNALAVVIFTLTFASLANAQATRTWVSGVGDDANPCSRTAPCKTFAGAISKTALGGEIDVLDPGGFGTLNITKSITIDGSGTFASVLNSGTNGFNINAGANDVITLRGLSIQGARQSPSPGTTGIKFNSGKGLNVINCIILNETQNGIEVTQSVNSTFVFVKNSVIKNCAGDGMSATTTTGSVKVMIEGTEFSENGTGLHAKAGSRITADGCRFVNSTNDGVFCDGTGAVSVANVTNSTIANNGTNGIEANTNGIGRINNCDIFTNIGAGALVGAGEIDTWGNNRIFSNGTDGCPSCTGKSVS
jgi:hypothetical protein